MKAKQTKKVPLSPEKAAIVKSLNEAAVYARKLAKQTNTKLIVRKTTAKH